MTTSKPDLKRWAFLYPDRTIDFSVIHGNLSFETHILPYFIGREYG